MYEEENRGYDQLDDEELDDLTSDNRSEHLEGIDFTKDFIWGSDQDEYIDES